MAHNRHRLPLATRPPAGLAEAAEAHLDDVYGYLLYLTRDRETAEDLASSTFEKAVRLWSRFDPRRGSARTWLLGIALLAGFPTAARAYLTNGVPNSWVSMAGARSAEGFVTIDRPFDVR